MVGGVHPRPGDVVDLLAVDDSPDVGADPRSEDAGIVPARLVMAGTVVVAVDAAAATTWSGTEDDHIWISVLATPAEAARLVGATADRRLVAVLAPPEASRTAPIG